VSWKTGYNCRMYRSCTIIISLLLLGIAAFPQEPVIDTTAKEPKKAEITEDDIDYDLLMDDLESFLDSISSPRSYFMGSLSMGKGFYNFKSKTNVFIETAQKFTYLPNISYFHKSGLSISATGNIVNDEEKANFYQLALTPGYDYLENRDLATGITYTRFFTKDSLSFYTTPLQNELYAYFTYRKWWIRPTVALSYGWGSRTDYRERESLIQDLRLRRNGITQINSTESVRDFSLITSLRHDFYWLNIFSYKDHFRFTPQLSFVSGTQKFGFNQSSTTYATVIRTGANVLYNSENVYLDDQTDFQPLSLTLFMRTEYSFGKFFVQPQLILDYYFPAADKNFSTLFSFNVGFMF
jgi:hypothetical protein